jgi:hypothetical protein
MFFDHGVSDECKKNTKPIRALFAMLETETQRKTISQALKRIRLVDPDLTTIHMDSTPADKLAEIQARQLGFFDQVAAASIDKALKAALKDAASISTWCASASSVDAWLRKLGDCENAEVTILVEAMDAVWDLLCRAEVSKNGNNKGSSDKYEKHRNRAASLFRDWLKRLKRKFNKGTPNWVDEAIARYVGPLVGGDVHGAPTSGVKSPPKKPPQGRIPQEDIDKWGDALLERAKYCQSKYESPHDVKTSLQKVFENAASAGAVASSAVKIAKKNLCSNCLFHGIKARHGHSQCQKEKLVKQ